MALRKVPAPSCPDGHARSRIQAYGTGQPGGGGHVAGWSGTSRTARQASTGSILVRALHADLAGLP